MDTDNILSKLLEWLILGGAGVIGFFLRDHHTTIKSMTKDHEDLRLKVAENYVHNNHFLEFKREIKEDLKEIKELIKDQVKE